MLARAMFKALQDGTGVPMEWHQTKPPQAQKQLVGLFARTKDEAIINSMGVGTVTIQLAAWEVTPEKFDRIIVGGASYTINELHPKLEAKTGTVISYTCLCKGK